MITYIFPFVASLLFVVGAMYARRSAELGGGIWRSSFVANILTSILFSSLWLLGGEFPGWKLLYQPALVGALFLVSQSLMFLSLDKGDVSIATPVLGTKIILVAAFQSALTDDPVSPKLWIAALLATLAVVLLSSSGGGERRRAGFTILTSFLCATGFALFDILVQKYSPGWGPGRFLPVLFFFVAVFSFGFIPFFKGSVWSLSGETRRAMGFAGLFIALQALTFVYGIAAHGKPTEMNVVYASRGLWSVLVVWMAGHWFHNRESEQGKSIFQRRLAGAGLLMVAIVIVLVLR